jgi:diguanylate cyclase (GGDEF)-like protein
MPLARSGRPAAGMRRDSFTILRETLRWRVALVLGALIMILMIGLGVFNTVNGFHDTARLAWVVLATSGGCVAALLLLPRQLGGTVFFGMIAVLLVAVMAFGALTGRTMHHWAFIFPPVLIFILRAGPALVAMIAFGAYTCWLIAPLLPPVDTVRFGSSFGLLICFMYTYALLEERAAAMLRYYSDHDALSNCLNRRTFNEAVEHLATSANADTRCTFLLIDIDHFKSINDQHGHLVGDRIITEVAATLGRVLDPGTPLYRYGGEEFSVLMTGADAAAGAALAEQLRATVAASDFHGVRVTISVGVAEWRAADGSISAALGRADRALYDAKRGGRDRVVTETLQAA